jgi:outer membrane protein assembly factor BamB
VWSIEVGIGHSSPVLSGTRIYVFTRNGEQETVAAYELASGKMIWKDNYDVPYNMNPAAINHGKGPKSTPVVANGKLYCFGISGILSSYEVASGKLLWRNDFKKEFPVTAADFGTAMSPLVDHDLLIVHAGGPGNGALLALDAATGKQRWSWKGDGPAYASPIAVNLGGVRQIVTQTEQNIVGVSEAKGELLWKIPFSTEYSQNAVTPVLYKDLLIFSGLNKGAFAVRLKNTDGKWVTENVWQNDRAASYLSSPVLKGDYLFGLSHFRKGQFYCLDARTGVTQWTSLGDEGENAAIVSAGSLLLFLNTDAELTIANVNPKKYDPIKKYDVADSPTWAHPALSGKNLLVKDLKSLTLWSFEN